MRTFKVSNDPRFAEKLEDVIGLYLNAPEHALVLCVDEKSQVQALDRTQPGLPLKKGRASTMTHDYVRHGTTTLFAALNVADGKVIGHCQARHRHQEWLKFLQLVDAQTPPERELHLILDNYATHKHPKVKAWLGKHPRFHLHFTPTSASWLNMAEHFFRDLTTKRLRRGVFHSVPELVGALEKYRFSAVSSGTESGEFEVEFCGFEIGDGAEEGEVAEASGEAFGQLHLAVDGFDGGAGNAALEEAKDARPVFFESARQPLEGTEPTARCLAAPPAQALLVAHGQHVLKAFAQACGLCFAQAVSLRSAHIIKLANEKIDQLQRALQRGADTLGYAPLKGTRYLLLSGRENVPEDKRDQLQEALRFNEPLSIAYYLKEELRALWSRATRDSMRRWLERWIERALDRGIVAMQSLAKTLRTHATGILNWFDHRSMWRSNLSLALRWCLAAFKADDSARFTLAAR